MTPEEIRLVRQEVVRNGRFRVLGVNGDVDDMCIEVENVDHPRRYRFHSVEEWRAAEADEYLVEDAELWP